MCSESAFLQDQLVQPIFIKESNTRSNTISGLGDNKLFNLKDGIKRIEDDLNLNCKNFILFPVQSKKTNQNFNVEFTNHAIKSIKDNFGSDLFLWVDLCICSLTKTGHCCIFKKQKMDIPLTLEALTKIAKEYSTSGVDGIAPSSMTPGIVKEVRKMLDK